MIRDNSTESDTGLLFSCFSNRLEKTLLSPSRLAVYSPAPTTTILPGTSFSEIEKFPLAIRRWEKDQSWWLSCSSLRICASNVQDQPYELRRACKALIIIFKKLLQPWWTLQGPCHSPDNSSCGWDSFRHHHHHLVISHILSEGQSGLDLNPSVVS